MRKSDSTTNIGGAGARQPHSALGGWCRSFRGVPSLLPPRAFASAIVIRRFCRSRTRRGQVGARRVGEVRSKAYVHKKLRTVTEVKRVVREVRKGAAATRSTITADVAVFTKLKTLELNGMGLDGARGTCFRASVAQVQDVTLCTGSSRDQLCSQSQPFRSNVCSRSGRQMMLQGHHPPSSEFE